MLPEEEREEEQEEQQEEQEQQGEQSEQQEISNANEVEVDGVKYTLDSEGNHCIGTAKVLDEGGVPFYNRTREQERKEQKYRDDIDTLNVKHQQELDDAKRTPEFNDDDIEPETEFSYKQLKALDTRNAKLRKKELQDLEIKTLNSVADNQISQEKFRLKQNPAYKDFFANAKYTKEADEHLAKLSLETALMPDIVSQVVDVIRGKYINEIVKAAEAKGRQSFSQQRKIVGEIELGKSAGGKGGGKVRITPEIRQLAKDGQMSIDSAADVIAARDARRKTMKPVATGL